MASTAQSARADQRKSLAIVLFSSALPVVIRLQSLRARRYIDHISRFVCGSVPPTSLWRNAGRRQRE